MYRSGIITAMSNTSQAPHFKAPDLEQLLNEQALLLEEKQDIIEKKSQVIEAQKKRIEMLEEGLRLINRKHFAPSSELQKRQGDLFNEIEVATDKESSDDSVKKTASTQKKGKGGRKGLSPTIPREQVHIDLSEEEKEGAIDTFYVVVKEELDKTPAKVRVLEYLQEKAVFKEEDKRVIKSAEMPKHPLGKSIASVNLLAYLIVSKYMDALPLHRLERILARYGGQITRSAMAGWLIRLSVQLQPLINLLWDHQLASDYIQMDETRIQVLKQKGYVATGNKYMWVSRGGPPDRPVVLFTYDPSREREVPARLLEGFEGTLQTDGYSGYDLTCQNNAITQIGCWDHARRKFKDAQDATPKKRKTAEPTLSDQALEKMGALYAVEKRFRTEQADPEAIYRTRQKESKPLLGALKKWADENRHKAPKDSLTGKAFTYLCNQWPKLIGYCENGHLHMSNILAENAIRPFAIGRKNWLFADTPQGAKASALYYSLIETTKANGVDPYDYLSKMLKQLPYASTVEEFEALLPWNMKSQCMEYRGR
jgi:transposase